MRTTPPRATSRSPSKRSHPEPRAATRRCSTRSRPATRPCLAQVGYETLTSFAAQGALEDVSEFADANKDEFTPASWSAMSIGDAVYGAPVDQAPMALFYNKEVFDGLGIAVPTTWDEYKAAGEKIHAADPTHFISSTYMDYDYAGFNWQAEAPWFGVEVTPGRCPSTRRQPEGRALLAGHGRRRPDQPGSDVGPVLVRRPR